MAAIGSFAPRWSLPRSLAPELMDDPALAEAEHLHALSALARINAVSRTAAQLAAGTRDLLAGPAGTPGPFTVVDIASGGGDVTIDVARLLRRSAGGRASARVVGVDFSPRAVARMAVAAADADP